MAYEKGHIRTDRGEFKDKGNQVVDITHPDFKAKGDGSTDDTGAISYAIEAAEELNVPVFIPPGTYLTDPIVGQHPGLSIIGCGPNLSVLKSRAGGPVIEVTGQTLHTLAFDNFGIVGSGGMDPAEHGLHIHDNSFQPYLVKVSRVRFAGLGGSGLLSADPFSISIIDSEADGNGGHGFEIAGTAATTLINCYAREVAAGKAGYRVYEGNPVLIGCNGIDTGSGALADWGVFGRTVADDGVDSFCRASLINCNIEDFKRYGVRCKVGSYANFISTQVIAPAVGTVTPLKFDFAEADKAGSWDNLSSVQSKGATYTNGYALNSYGLALIAQGSDLATYWDTNAGAARNLPTVQLALVSGLYGAYAFDYIRANTFFYQDSIMSAGANDSAGAGFRQLRVPNL